MKRLETRVYGKELPNIRGSASYLHQSVAEGRFYVKVEV